jgi:hypothetical protein
MAITLGTLLVELQANTASFIAGMTKAGQKAQGTAKEIEGAFAGLGGTLEQLLGPFGEMGSRIAASFSVASGAMKSSVGAIGQVGSALGPLGALAATGTVAIAALGVGLVGIAAWASKGASELQHLSEKTGINVEQLSVMSEVAKESGISQEQMAKALEKMGKSAFAAATAAPGTINAYTRLGIEVKNANGVLKTSSELYAEVADKFKELEDGPAKTAVAMQLFGRAGAEMIPTLNKGSAALKQTQQDMQDFGAVIGADTAKQALQFQVNIDRMGLALQGITNFLMKELLPTMNSVMTFIIDELKDTSGGFSLFATAVKYAFVGVIDAVKIVVVAVATIAYAFDNVYTMVNASIGAIVRVVAGLGVAIGNAIQNKSLKGFGTTMADSFNMAKSDFMNTVTDEAAKTTERYQKLLAGTVYGASSAPEEGGKKKKLTALGSEDGKNDFIQAKLNLLKKEADGQEALATATDVSTAATLKQKAANEASLIVEKLTEQIGKSKKALRADEKAELDRLTPAIYAAVAAHIAFKEASDVRQTLQKATEAIALQNAALRDHVAAVLAGGDAMKAAQERADMAPYVQKLQQAKDLLDTLSIANGNTAKQIEDAATAYRLAQLQLANYNAEAKEHIGLELQKAYAEEARKLDDSREAMSKALAVQLQFSGNLKEARVQMQLLNFKSVHQGIDESSDAYQKFEAQIRATSDVMYQQQAQEQVLGKLQFEDINNQIAALEKLKATRQGDANFQLAVDGAIHEDQVRQLQDFMKLNEAANTVGGSFNAFFAQMKLNTMNLGKDLVTMMDTAFNSLSDTLTKFVTGQKVSFAQLAQSIEADFMKTGIKNLLSQGVGAIGKMFHINLPGMGAKMDGSDKSHAMWVQDANGLGGGGLLGGIGNALNQKKTGDGTSSDSGGLSKLLSNLTSKMGSAFSGIFSKLGGMLSGIFSHMSGFLGKIGGLFSGLFHADGGFVQPGRMFIAGERGIETVTNTGAGARVVPGAPTATNKAAMHVTQQFNITTPDADSFKRSQSQIAADAYASLAMAHARNR